MMNTNIYGEIWKEVKLNYSFHNEVKIEISNFGRARRTVAQKTEMMKTYLAEGYYYIKQQLYLIRDEGWDIEKEELGAKVAAKILEIRPLLKTRRELKSKNQSLAEIQKIITKKQQELELLRVDFTKVQNKNRKKWDLYKSFLVHRLVAEAFLEKPTANQVLVAHLDFNKINNHFSNLKWMDRVEAAAHHKKSPFVIAALKKRIASPKNENTKVYKLTSTKVMLIKKKINQGTTLRTLSKTFKVTQTQLLRIKRGINWAHVPAAK